MNRVWSGKIAKPRRKIARIVDSFVYVKQVESVLEPILFVA